MIVKNETILREMCDDVSIFEAQDIIRKLEIELVNSDVKGVGLSANQINLKKKFVSFAPTSIP